MIDLVIVWKFTNKKTAFPRNSAIVFLQPRLSGVYARIFLKTPKGRLYFYLSAMFVLTVYNITSFLMVCKWTTHTLCRPGIAALKCTAFAYTQSSSDFDIPNFSVFIKTHYCLITAILVYSVI